MSSPEEYMKRDQDQRLSLAYTVLFGGREKTCIETGRSSQRCRERREGNERETDDS